jgi:hypothetical protein
MWSAERIRCYIFVNEYRDGVGVELKQLVVAVPSVCGVMRNASAVEAAMSEHITSAAAWILERQ